MDGRGVEYRDTTHDELWARWDADHARRLSYLRDASGELDFFLDRDDGGRYALWARSYGSCVIEAGGEAVLGAPAAESDRHWQAFVIGQVLPICAVLQGVETFHASAVVRDGGATAFVAPSGVGKTSVAVHRALAGAEMLTDDVLAVSLERGAVMAHPGAPVASLRGGEYERLSIQERVRLGPERRRDDQRASFDIEVHAEPVPLRAMCFLERSTDVRGVRCTPADDPRLLLGSSFVFVVQNSARLERQLSLCAVIARRANLVRVQIPPGISARALARELEEAGL